MKIILKNTYNGGKMEFDNKNELIRYVDDYKYNLDNYGEYKNKLKRITVNEIIELFFGDYKIERENK